MLKMSKKLTFEVRKELHASTYIHVIISVVASMCYHRIKKARENTDEDDIPIVLAGNKSDQSEQRVVTTEEAQEFADSVGCEYYETSSKDDINVNQIFEALLRGALKRPEKHELKVQPEKVEVGPEKKLEGDNKSANLEEPQMESNAVVEEKPKEEAEEPVKLKAECKQKHRHHKHSSCPC